MINIIKRREKKMRCKTKLEKVLSKFETKNPHMRDRSKAILLIALNILFEIKNVFFAMESAYSFE